MKIDFVKTLEASSPYTPGRIYFEESTSLIKVATASNQYRVFGGVRSADYDSSTDILTILNGNGDEIYIDFSQYVKQDEYEDDQYVVSVALNELNDNLASISESVSYLEDTVQNMNYDIEDLHDSIPTDSSIAAWGYLKANDVSTKADSSTIVWELSSGTQSARLKNNEGEASGDYAISAGLTTIASGNCSFASGRCTKSIGSQSFSLGTFSSAAGSVSLAFGGNWAAGVKLTGDANATTYTGTVTDPHLSYLLENYYSSHGTSIANAFKSGGSYIYNDPSTYITSFSYSSGTITVTFNKTLSSSALSNSAKNISSCIAAGEGSVVFTGFTGANAKWAIAGGRWSMALGLYSVSYGNGSITSGQSSITVGDRAESKGSYSQAFGYYALANNQSEHAVGQYNKSNKTNTTFGNAGNTAFSIGIGTSTSDRKNALEIMQSGDAYLTGVGGYTGANYSSSTSLQSVINGKLSGVSFNGTTATVTNGVAAITATIPPDNVFIIPVTKSGTTYSTTLSRTDIRNAMDAGKLLFVLYNRMVMPLRSYDSEEYGDWYFTIVNNTYICTMHLLSNGNGNISCYYSETALPSAITESTVSEWGFTKNTGTLTGVKFNNTNATINGTVAEITATIPTVNNATLSILKNGTSVGTFTANSSTDTSINIQVNELPTPSTLGTVLHSNGTSWVESQNIYDAGDTVQITYNKYLTATGSLGETTLDTAGILKTNFSDWSWIRIQYLENNTTVTNNLQDYLDARSLPTPTTWGQIVESYFNTTNGNYEWKISGFQFISPYLLSAPVNSGGFVTSNSGGGNYGLDSYGLWGNVSNWSWIKIVYSSNGTTVTETLEKRLLPVPTVRGQFVGSYLDSSTGNYVWRATDTLVSTSNDWSWLVCNPVTAWTLQDTLNGKQNTLVGSGTGQNIKTVNNNSLVGSGNVSVGTLTGVKFNNVSATINGTIAEITATIPPEVTASTVAGWGFTKNTGTLTEHATHKLTATNNNATSTSGTITFVESLTGTNTATSGDLTITATRKSVTIPAAANNATITIQKGGTNVDSFTVDASSNKTINIPNELPTVTASDNGKILKVVNGAWASATPVTVYSGSNAPNSSTGINGDIYIQS